MFDPASSGKIDVKDLEEIMRNLQRDPHEARDLLYAIDPDNTGSLDFEKFVQLLLQVDSLATQPIEKGTPQKKRKSISQVEERKSPLKGGSTMSGLPPYYLGPDTKVLDFLR